MTYNRVVEWEEFSVQVERHITDYTLPQYGSDAGDEQVDEFTVEDCCRHMERYLNRRKSNVRGDKERLRDLIKIAHYASFAYQKLRGELDAGDVYPAYEPHARMGMISDEDLGI